MFVSEKKMKFTLAINIVVGLMENTKSEHFLCDTLGE